MGIIADSLLKIKKNPELFSNRIRSRRNEDFA